MKISDSMVGHVVLEETKAKQSSSQKGVPKSEETRKRIAAARRRRPQFSAVDACRMEAKRRMHAFDTKRRKRYKEDLRIAYKANKMDLWQDIRQSWGWKSKRKMFDPIVSDGIESDMTLRKRKT